MTTAERIRAAIAWYRKHKSELPTEPFQLHQGVWVGRPERFYSAIEALADGWDGSDKHVYVAGLLLKLRSLRQVFNSR